MGVMLVPFELEFGWTRSAISLAVFGELSAIRRDCTIRRGINGALWN